MKKVKVGKSKIHGNGLFADEPIKRGDVIELVHTMRELEPGVMKTTPTLLGRNYNHSDDSNALNVVDGNNRYLVALKEIEVGGEITTDYKTNPELEQPGSFASNDNYISFDYDDTLTTPEGFKLAQQMNKEGKNLYVITARDKVTPQMIERAEAAGIPKENIITAGSDEAKVKIVKENNISKHIDNKESVIKALGDTGELFTPDAYPDLKADFIEMDLSENDLNKLKEGGFVIEEYANGGEPDPKTNFYTVKGSEGVYRKVNGKWEVDWNRSGNFQPLSKGDVAKRTAVLNSQAKPLYDPVYNDLYTTQRQQFTPKPVNKPKSTGKIESFDNSLYSADETTDDKPVNYVDKNDPSKLYIIFGNNVIQPGRPGESFITDKDEIAKIKKNTRIASQFDLDRLPANQIYSSPEELEYIRRAASGEDPYTVNAELKNKETANKDQIFFNNAFELKEIDPNKWDPMRLETAKEMSDKSIDFLQQWQQSPMYYEMLRNSAGEDFEYHKRGRDVRFLDGNLDPRFVNRDDPTAIGRSFGDGKIEFYPQTSFTDLDVIPHEYSHATDNNGRYIPKKDIELLKSYTTDPKETRLYTQGYATDSDLNKQYEYLTMPTETRARINALRFASKQSGVYDPFTQKVDPDTFKRFENIDTWFNDDGIRENTPLKDLKKVYTDEQIIEMLNTISKNNESNQEFNFAQNGGQQGDRFKKRLMKRYPGMQGVYGAEGENLSIVKDPNYNTRSAGYGDIEFIHPGSGLVTYSDDYQYQSPTPDKYTAVYNPKGANRGDVFLDMMHGMRDDPNYQPLLQNFDNAVRNARGGDMEYFYNQDAKEGYTDGQEQWDENYVDSQLRAQLALGTLGMFSQGRKDYRKDRKYDSPEMRAAAKDVRNYLKGEYEDGGELDTYPKGGGPGKGKKGKSKNVQPFVTSNPADYAYRKAAYDDSLRTYQMAPNLKRKENYIDAHSLSMKDNRQQLFNLWKQYGDKGFNFDLGYNQRTSPKRKVSDGVIGHQIYDYKKPVQPVQFKKPKSTQGATKKIQPIVEQEVIEPTLVSQPIPTPIIVNPELQKFVEEEREPGTGSDVMPVYDTDELPMYATPDRDAQWIGDTERYVDWDGNKIPYRLPRFRKPGHGGDLIRQGKKRYIPFPSIESRYQAEIVPEEEYKKGGEPKKRKKDSKGRYRSEDGNIRTPLTPEMQATMPSDEWGQYVQEVPEVYTTRTREQQDIKNALDYQQRMAELYPGMPTQSDAIQPADWLWQLGMLGAAEGLGKSAIGAVESLGSRALPYVEGALNTSIPGMASVPGATVGNALGAGFAADAMVNRLPEGVTQLSNGEYVDAAGNILTGLLDVAGAGMVSPIYQGAKSTVSELGKFVGTEEGLLSNAYKGYKEVPRELPGSPNGTLAYRNVTPSRVRSTNTGLTEANIDEEVANNIKWITSPEYARRRAANTGESLEEIQKSVDNIIKDADKAKFNLNSNPWIADLYERSGVMKSKTWLRPAKVEVSASAEQPIQTLNHEIKHLYSPAIYNNGRVYDNYPTLGDAADDYLGIGAEQQVRHLNAREQILAENNLPIDAQLSEEQVREFVDGWGSRMNKMNKTNDFSLKKDFDAIWNDEAAKIQKEMLKARYNKDDLSFIGTLPTSQKVKFISEYRDRLTRSITDALNKAWVTVPIAGGAGLNSLEPSEQRYGGSISKLNKFIR